RVRAPGRVAVPGSPALGGDRALGSRPCVLRVVRRPAQLLHRFGLRPPGRRPDPTLLAGGLPRHRQGHPEVPHRVLARPPDCRRYESGLANEYGNLASRTIAMVQRYRDGVVPAVERDPVLEEDLAGLPQEVAALMDRAEPTLALEHIWRRVRRLNRYVEERAP